VLQRPTCSPNSTSGSGTPPGPPRATPKGTRRLCEVLLLARRIPAEQLTAGIAAALQVGSTDPAVVAVEARRHSATALTGRAWGRGGEVDLHRRGPADHPDDVDVGESDQSTAQQRRLDEHRDPQGGWRQTPPSSRGPCACPSTLSSSSTSYRAPPTSEAPNPRTGQRGHADIGSGIGTWPSDLSYPD
jgi:hypothetical protein